MVAWILGGRRKQLPHDGGFCRTFCDVGLEMLSVGLRGLLTLAIHSLAVYRGATDHYIVDDGEAALAPDPVALTVLDAAV